MWSVRIVIASDGKSSAGRHTVIIRASTVCIANEQLTVAFFADLTFPVRTRVAVGSRVERQVAHEEAVSDTCQTAVHIVNDRLAVTIEVSEPVLT